jgi:hypothetical protein
VFLVVVIHERKTAQIVSRQLLFGKGQQDLIQADRVQTDEKRNKRGKNNHSLRRRNFLMLDFTSVEAGDVARLASTMDANGFAVIENFFSPEQLQLAREEITQETIKHGHEYFAIHGVEAMEGTMLGSLGASTTFRSLLSSLYEVATGSSPSPAERIFPVIRCLQGRSGLKETTSTISMQRRLLPWRQYSFPLRGNTVAT